MLKDIPEKVVLRTKGVIRFRFFFHIFLSHFNKMFLLFHRNISQHPFAEHKACICCLLKVSLFHAKHTILHSHNIISSGILFVDDCFESAKDTVLVLCFPAKVFSGISYLLLTGNIIDCFLSYEI